MSTETRANGQRRRVDCRILWSTHIYENYHLIVYIFNDRRATKGFA